MREEADSGLLFTRLSRACLIWYFPRQAILCFMFKRVADQLRSPLISLPGGHAGIYHVSTPPCWQFSHSGCTFFLFSFLQEADKFNFGSSFSSYSPTAATRQQSRGRAPTVNSNLWTPTRWPDDGASARASPTWTTTSWAARSGTITTRTLWPKFTARGTPISLTLRDLLRPCSPRRPTRQPTNTSRTCLYRATTIARNWISWLRMRPWRRQLPDYFPLLDLTGQQRVVISTRVSPITTPCLTTPPQDTCPHT